MAKNDLVLVENEVEKWVKINFEDAPASSLNSITNLQEKGGLDPVVFGEMCQNFIEDWSFKPLDPKNPEDYGKLKLGDYRYVLKEFTARFQRFFE